LRTSVDVIRVELDAKPNLDMDTTA